MNRVVRYMAALALPLLVGCNAGAPPASQPAANAEPLTLLVPGSPTWTADEARANLATPRCGVSAAVRLLRLAQLDSLSVPRELGDTQFRRLRLRPLGADRWALGLADPRMPAALRAAVLITADGVQVLLPEEQELVRLHVSDDADIFPHLVILPDRVYILEPDALVPALALAPEHPVRFELRDDAGYRYVGLLLLSARDPEVTRYRWDPYESAFMGPAADKLPDPPGGTFQLDLDACERLVPVGGELLEPEENADPPPRRPPPSRWLPA